MTLTSDILPGREAAPGFLWAFAGTAEGGTRRVPIDGLGEALAGPRWVWVHVDLLDQRARSWARTFCGLSPETALLDGTELSELTSEAICLWTSGVMCRTFSISAAVLPRAPA